MTCNLANFRIEEFIVDKFPHDPYCGVGCLKPGDIVELYAQAFHLGGSEECTCATVAFSLNGVEIDRREVCLIAISGRTSYWGAYSYLEATTTYIIKNPGVHNFCAEVVSVR